MPTTNSTSEIGRGMKPAHVGGDGQYTGGAERWKRGLALVLFATAMAYVESAVVYYLRTMIHRIEPYQPDPLPVVGGLAGAEIAREAATLVMLATAGWLAGRNLRTRFGYFLIAFGVWDIFYYVFLRALTSWPHSLLDWDILFLIPLPWWGPVLAPVLIALLMIAWGALATQVEPPPPPIWPKGPVMVLSLCGVALALYVFMADAWRVSGGGMEAIRQVLPVQFKWALFCVALALMATPIVHQAAGLWSRSCSAIGAREPLTMNLPGHGRPLTLPSPPRGERVGSPTTP
jgi:hypothetical protein